MRTLAVRLLPGQDLKRELADLVRREEIEAGCVLTCVGSLTQVALRFADRHEATTLTGRFEIVSLVGTLSPDGLHLHMAVSDGDGCTVGGHVMDGNLIHTTAEVVIGKLPGVKFTRTHDERTGYKELTVEVEEG